QRDPGAIVPRERVSLTATCGVIDEALDSQAVYMEQYVAARLDHRRDDLALVDERRHEVEGVLVLRVDGARVASGDHLPAREAVQRKRPLPMRRRQEHAPGRVDVAEHSILCLVLDDLKLALA